MQYNINVSMNIIDRIKSYNYFFYYAKVISLDRIHYKLYII